MAAKLLKNKARVAMYPGSFDPITNGHLALVEKAVQLFDFLYVAVGTNTTKNYTFSIEERVNMIAQATRRYKNVKVEAFYGLVVDYAKTHGARVVIRGLRAISDYELEMQMALTNRKLNPRIETIFLLPSEEYFYLSSGLIREISRLGGNVSNFVPPHVEKALRTTLASTD